MPTEPRASGTPERLPARAPGIPKSTDQTPDTDQPDDSTADLADEFESGSIEGGEVVGADVTLTTFDDASELDDASQVDDGSQVDEEVEEQLARSRDEDEDEDDDAAKD